MAELSEQEMIEGCSCGNPIAQEQLYKRFASKMFGICMRYSSNRMEAEDTLHEGFMRVYKNIDKFKNAGSFEGWVRRIMINCALKKYQQEKKLYLKQDEIDGLYDLSDDNIPNGLDRLNAADMTKMVQSLAPGFRMVFNLYAIEGYSHKEIGEMMGISESTSKSQLSRARIILQRMLGMNRKESFDKL
ncbi:MAG: sigma-70 family RNA polymerase sigma factor [Bacteroidetes bacterium]|nr:sigma-70 family RNA polymerase sigma factor [Bacteroidota bacterium]